MAERPSSPSLTAAPSLNNQVVSNKPKIPGFVDSFWSPDYAGGLGVLFQKLQQGVIENQQILTIATMRAEAEEMYSERLGDIAPTIDRMNGGFARDDGASTRKAYEGVRSEMVEATKNHQKIANNIRELVVHPFGRWCDAHATRVQNSQDDLQSKIKALDRQAELVKKLRAAYFGKCRLVEDAEEENKLAFQDPEKEQPSPKPVKSPSSPPPTIVIQEEIEELPVEIGERTYTPEQVKRIMAHMLETIPLGEARVPILGTYQNTSTGTDITEYVMKHMGSSGYGMAEQIGQDLVDRGFLRLVGNMGSTFANSSKMKYQWKPKAWQTAGLQEKKPLGRASTMSSIGSVPDSPIDRIGNLSETLQGWNPLNNPHPNETPAEKLRREARESDERYKAAVRKLDLLRCNLEESMMDHLKFLERCETDRLKAIRSVILDFSGAISNSIPSFQSQVDHMMLYQETIQPLGDLRYLLENYRTGQFVPKVTPYENYYGSVEGQTFGVDLEARARADKKRVPVVITAILTYLDSHYPDLEGDDARRSIWLIDVPLAATHHLRNSINDGKPVPRELLERYEIPIVASVLKLYLLELPGKLEIVLRRLIKLTILDSLVSSQVYEIVKTIYNTTSDAMASTDSPDSIDSAPRIKVLQSTLGQLRLNNIATLDALMTHFTRLIDLTSAEDAYVTQLAQTLAPCILRPRAESSLTMEERHAYRLVRDLFEHKEAIFGELKRQSSTLSHSNSMSNRQRAISTTDESSRRQAMEARAKAINQERQRAKSPNPGNRHRRDHSTGGSIGRFPVVASPRPDQGNLPKPAKRSSLEVPGSTDSSPTMTRTDTDPRGGAEAPTPFTAANGHSTLDNDMEPMQSSFSAGPGPHIPPPLDDDMPSAPMPDSPERTQTGSIKRKSMGAVGHRMASRGSLKMKTNLSTAEGVERTSTPTQGVQLNDAPMDMDDFS